MPRTEIALLRGINVGTAKRIAMADLKKVVEKLGYGDVRTLLNSGNVVFTAPAAARGDSAARIEEAIAARFGFSARVTVFTAAELAAVVAEEPLSQLADNPSLYLVGFLNKPADGKLLQPLTRQKWTPGALALGRRVAYLWCPEGSLKSPLAIAANRALKDAVTVRNWATVTKLHALAGEA